MPNIMMQLMFRYIMCNVLLAWATLQQPYIPKTLSSPPPQNKNKWVHSIIFEPQLKIQLTRSSLSNNTCLKKFLDSPTCTFHPYACQSKMKFEQY